MTRQLGVLGGTFDPIHVGHLDAADAARSALALDEVLFVPSHDPPHRPMEPHANAFHRFALVALAIDNLPGYRVSDVEARRPGSSYTSDTLRALHAAGWRPSELFFILGTDAFADIATWHEFPGVLDDAHFVIVARPGTAIGGALAGTPELRQRVRPLDRANDRAGRTAIFLVEARTRDVSSTTVRARLAARQPIDDLVPPAVARHIAAHRLYVESNLHGHSEKVRGT
ncbi:MAG: nicotinate (nicotinamide) nucleotide adenylyltransferase [Acidobacteria bacterium RIFCSPLOWO2_02_FULL_68_18]|nr:MAG: nicotinate (nicotinamide) nucleotide adenylyltransferase [Acidobacteria bacterium RIFCSPLOWO2_02_FULL_68_18]OFW50986.1 MAG: nicotinate (nicotinamide) nucleotide adenylyltransferase [Acidobacteria bacterium RIFCSPLOWO2_12_FULL_68_19]